MKPDIYCDNLNIGEEIKYTTGKFFILKSHMNITCFQIIIKVKILFN